MIKNKAFSITAMIIVWIAALFMCWTVWQMWTEL